MSYSQDSSDKIWFLENLHFMIHVVISLAQISLIENKIILLSHWKLMLELVEFYKCGFHDMPQDYKMQ